MKLVSNGKSIEVPSCGALDIYSTEEQVVGRWIDGKPIYSKSFAGVSPASKGVFPFADISDLSIDTVVEISGVTNSGLETGTVELPCTRSDTSLFLAGVSGDKKKLNTFVNGTEFYAKAFHCTLKYTKTTDQATIELPAAPAVSMPAYAAAPQSVESAVLDAGVETEEV